MYKPQLFKMLAVQTWKYLFSSSEPCLFVSKLYKGNNNSPTLQDHWENWRQNKKLTRHLVDPQKMWLHAVLAVVTGYPCAWTCGMLNSF